MRRPEPPFRVIEIVPLRNGERMLTMRCGICLFRQTIRISADEILNLKEMAAKCPEPKCPSVQFR